MTVLPRTGEDQGQQDGQQEGTKDPPTPETDDIPKPSVSTQQEPEESPKKTSEVIEEVQQKLDQIDMNKETQILDSDFDENGEPVFPNDELGRLDEMVNRPKWVIPVLPNGELEVLIDASIKLAKKGLDIKSENCQKFIKDGMTISFNKIFLDDAVSTWKFEIHKYIMRNAEKLIELCVAKLDQDWFPLLDLLAVVLDPKSRFHQYNASRTSETFAGTEDEKPCYAKPSEVRQPRGWLVDLINKFGTLGGFDKLKKRLCEGGNINIPVICAHIRPFGQCAEFLSVKTIEDSLMPCVYLIKKYMEGLTDEELKKESKQESKNEVISTIIRSMKNFASRLNDQEEFCKQLEKLRLQMILRLLQVSSFNGKMNALNEINRVISNVSYYSHRHHGYDDIEYLTMEMVAEWLQENRVLSVVLKDNLHQPQYVEKLDKIIRFAIKVKTLTLDDLDTIWNAQIGKHEAIVKNVHDLLAKLAWDFSAEQLDHLFARFQASWKEANKKQQEKLLELIRRLAEDDKEGVIAHKVLWLLWHLAHSDDLPTDIMDQALVAHIKILDFSCSQTQDRDNLKIEWIKHSLDELRHGRWVIPALKQIKAICELFYEGYGQMQNPHVQYRNVVIEKMQNTYGVVSLVAENLSLYMDKVRELVKADPNTDPNVLASDGRYTHTQQIQERLDFLRFILNDGKMWLCEPQAKQIWICLAVRSVFPCDMDVCFLWFSKVMSDDPDLDPEICKQFFEDNVFKLDAGKLNEHGLRCFERFFKYVNTRESVLSKKRNGTYILENTQLIGYDYLWKIILNAPQDIALKAIEILKEIYTNLGSDLKTKPLDIHNRFIKDCMNRLNPSYEVLKNETDNKATVKEESRRIVLCLKTLKEYVAECDKFYPDERAFLPHERACRGKHVTLYIRFSPQARQSDDFEIWSHTNESLASVRRHIYQRLKMSAQNVKLDLHFNGEILSTSEDRKLVGQIPLKDRAIITVKLGAVGGSSPSSPDSSSDSSPPPTPQPGDGPNLDAEQSLPGVIMSKMKFANSLFLLGDLGMKHKVPELRDISLSLLNIIPTDVDTSRRIRLFCQDKATKGSKSTINLDCLFFSTTAMNVLYNLQVVYALLMPSAQPCSEMSTNFQHDFILAGGIKAVINMLTKSNFLAGCDTLVQRSAFQTLLKIAKLMFTVISYAQVSYVAEALNKESGRDLVVTAHQHNTALVLQQALQHIPNPCQECVLRSISFKLGQSLAQQAIVCIPDMSVIQVLQKLAWVAAAGFAAMSHAQLSEVHASFEKPSNRHLEPEDVALARESLEVLTIAIMLCPTGLETLTKDRQWQLFINDMILICKSRAIRVTASEQFFLIATKCTNGDKPIRFFIQLLFTVRDTIAAEHPEASSEYFGLLCRLLNFGRLSELQLNNSEAILEQEISWLSAIWDKAVNSADGREVVHYELLDGHLGITRELLSYQTSQKKYLIGSDPEGHNLLKHIVDDFIFSGSRLAVEAKKGGDIFSRHVNPVCQTPGTTITALDLLVALCSGCMRNLRRLSEMLTEMYYEGIDPTLTEWEYQPPIGPRPVRGFVGLKNAGATCYMNSVLQQLYMIPEIRTGILEVDMGPADVEEDQLEIEDKIERENVPALNYTGEVDKLEKDSNEAEKSKEQERKEYNLKVLRQVQGIFGHLSESKLQFHIPRGFWKSFRLWGEPVNLREQHDALEFFNTLVENLDEGLKGLGKKTMLTRVLGGSFADQKICKTCPHRYSRETPFTALNVDVRNHHTLIDSLEQYVKGDLLEGANAYHCERCDKKVDTVKRMCIKTLPKVLAIHLKRFDYDWERDCAIKFNDYFEFPRQFDMEPFTVEGLAKIEGEIVEDDRCEEKEKDEIESEPKVEKPGSTVYNLVGVVVHSGQASGGHYYSYIIPRPSVDSETRWYKFDDGEVSECVMDDDEMKNQCFGGEYMGEVFDHMLKRMSYRRQKRWWNAYILFYERLDICEKIDRVDPEKGFKIDMPGVIERSVRKQNIQFLHNRTQFSAEYFQFIRKLVMSNAATFQNLNQQHLSKISQPEREDLALISLQLLCKFLFMVGFHTKKNIRGPASEWGEVLSGLLKQSSRLRHWFAVEMLLSRPERMVEYLIDCPVAEIRSAFAKCIVYLAHTTRQDGHWSPDLMNNSYSFPSLPNTGMDPQKTTLSDYILKSVLELINKDATDNNKYLVQYFQLFVMYVGFGVPERKQLLDLGVLQTFIRLAFEDERSTTSRYPYSELTKLYSLVSILIRSCDVSKSMKSSIEEEEPKTNRFYDNLIEHPIMPIPPDVEGLIYTSNYVKKLLEESASSEETINLLKFLSWECFSFSLIALSEVLFQISYTYSYELRPYLDILLHLLLMEDSWQNQRLQHAFRGVSDDREGLFDTIQRSKAHSQKRGYQCIKAIVQLLNNSEAAVKMIRSNDDLKHRWKSAIQWLGDELERRAPSAYNYNNWSPPTQSNETSNGYFLERSQSARLTYAKAGEFFEEEPDEEPELEGESEAQTGTEEKMDLTSDDKEQPQTRVNASDNIELSPESLDSSLQDLGDSLVQSEDIPLGEESD